MKQRELEKLQLFPGGDLSRDLSRDPSGDPSGNRRGEKKGRGRRRTLHRCRALLLAALTAAACVLPVSAANTRGRNTTAVKSGCQIVNAGGTYEEPDTAALLKRINAIRLEACTAGNVPDPRNPSRMLTKSDYVPVTWSTELEKMAQLRAAESSFLFEHSRPNGDSSVWSAAYGVQSGGENLAPCKMAKAIEMWYAEKANWMRSKVFSGNTGHYYNLIDPSKKSVALGCFTNASNSTSTAYQVSGRSNLASKKTGEYGAYTQQIEMTTANAKKYGFVSSAPVTVAATGVKLNKTSCSLTVGSTVTLTATVSPTNATNKNVTWMTSNSAIASVSGGKVTAKKAGTATITVKTANGKTAACKVTVTAKPSSPGSGNSGTKPASGTKTLKLSSTKLSLTPGQQVKLTATGATGTLTVKSADIRYATIDRYLTVRAYRPGKTTLTVTDASGAKGTVEVTVAYKTGENVKINLPKTTIRLKVGQKVAWRATISPASTTDRIMNYTYSTNKIISYSNWTITALRPGTEKITVHTFGGKTAVCTVIVTN